MLLILGFANLSKAQSGKGLVFNGTNQSVQFPVTGLPTGVSPRTLEFWLRATPETDIYEHHIINWGQPGDTGTAFGVRAQNVRGSFCLGFWGHYRDSQFLTVSIPDEDWHFVALTYDGSRLRCYLDGEMRADPTIGFNTASGPLYIGNRAPINGQVRNWEYFDGCVRDIAIWSYARSQYQIQMDMIPWPAITGNEAGLVTYIPLNEGSGNTFSDKRKSASGNIGTGATWSKPIAADPNPADEGIWFLIQNKADLDNDTSLPAKRVALQVDSNGRTSWAPVPLSGDYNGFLWRTVKDGDKVRIISKKFGNNSGLKCNMNRYRLGFSSGRFSLYQIYVDKYSDTIGHGWKLEQAALLNWGTNAYAFTNTLIGKLGELAWNIAKYPPLSDGTTNSVWVLQPMQLAMGYHIPTSAAANSPMTQEIVMPYGFKVYGSNTVRDWSILNGHLIWKNMLNSVYSVAGIAKLNSTNYSRKEIQIISRYDQGRVATNYPLNMEKSTLVQDDSTFIDYRGSSYTNLNLQLSSTTVTEEMMCRRGTFSRGYKDRDFREFDQTIHEFGHALDKIMDISQDVFPEPTLYGSPVEAVAVSIQAWFNNNNSYSVFARTRGTQRVMQPGHYGRLNQYFRESNTWQPPRWLRNQPDGRVELKDGDTLKIGDWIYSSPPYGTGGVFARLEPDGDLEVYTNDGPEHRQESLIRFGIPKNKVKYMIMSNGVLQMKDATGKDVYKSPNSQSTGARLIVAQPLPSKPNSWMRIVDTSGNVLWNP